MIIFLWPSTKGHVDTCLIQAQLEHKNLKSYDNISELARKRRIVALSDTTAMFIVEQPFTESLYFLRYIA